MPRLIAAFLFVLPWIAWAQTETSQAGFKQAGVCSRCHVVQVLEWSVGKHQKAGIVCASCHGASRGHVANERNQVKPDRVPHEAAIAALCKTCHAPGCPKTKNATDCQRCHHPHALVNPMVKPVAELPEDTTRAEVRRRMEMGEQQARAGNFSAARTEYTAASKLAPTNRLARARVRMCERRMKPGLAGFRITGQEFDPESGLPRRVAVEGLGTEMALVPGGEAELGSDRLPDSRPRHSVRLEAFYLGVREVTQKEWAFTGAPNPSVHHGDDLPVNNVSWKDCQEWIARLNKRVTGAGFRLPMEAEWEFAAHAEQGEPADAAWYLENSLRTGATAQDYRQLDAYAPRPGGQKRASAAGFYDVRGNVWEWCSSLLKPYPYDARDGRESATAEGMRVLRGGGYADQPDFLDPALRHPERPSRRQPWNGMRLARSVPE